MKLKKIAKCSLATALIFGSASAFDDLAWKVVTTLKNQYPNIKRIYVRSAYQYIDNDYQNYLSKMYEESYFPAKIQGAGKYSYVERNYEMIKNSNVCVFYYNENYTPKIKTKSGTKLAYQYAVKTNKQIINLYD